MLASSMILFGATLKDGNRHDPADLPVVVAGRAKGLLKPGRRVWFEKQTPLCTLHLSMMHRMGVKADSFGDSTGVLNGLS